MMLIGSQHMKVGHDLDLKSGILYCKIHVIMKWPII